MVKEPDEEEQSGREDENGGPIKSFLEHLEDLRWTLIKCVVAVLLAMLVSLVAGNKLVALLTWPLRYVQMTAPRAEGIPVFLGTNFLGNYPTNALGLSVPASNHIGALRLTPIRSGTNWLLSMEVDFTGTPPPRPALVLKNYTPLGGIMVALKLGIYGGLIFASPFLLFFIGQFVLPALKIREKKILFRAVAFGSVLFFLGVAFCYFVVAGVSLVATVQFSQWMGFGADEWRAEDYISFMCKFMLGMGIGFELPVVILTLVKIGLIDYFTLKRFRQYAVVGNLIIAAVATPSGDPFTMFLMALPLQFLYEVSTLIAWYWQRRDRKRQQAEELPTD